MGDTKIISSTPSVFKVDDKFDDVRFMKVRIAAMHSGKNLNGSSFSTDVIKSAQDSFKNIAVLANVRYHEDEDGNEVMDFGGHDMHVQEDAYDQEQDRVIYDEKVVGIVPETNNFEIVHDDEHNWDVVNVDALLYKDYGNYVCDILNDRGGKTDVSAEIYCPDISYDADSGTVVVNKMIMSGITLLGADKTPAMTGANASVFSIEKDSKDQQMMQIMKELKESLDHYIAVHGEENSKEGGKEQVKFEELLKKYNVTKDDVKFETDGLSDEELEAKFAEAFATSEEDNSDAVDDKTIKYSVNGKDFSLALDDIQYALTMLVNNTYAQADDVYFYSCDIYPDEKYVVMYDPWGNRKNGYKQSYDSTDDVFNLIGDRVEVHQKWITDEEENSIKEMKANYSSISDELAKYHDEPKKAQILSSDVYSEISDDAEFKKLCENHFDLSIDDVEKKADEILLKNAKEHKLAYSVDKKKTNVKPLPRKIKRDFGKLFNDIED